MTTPGSDSFDAGAIFRLSDLGGQDLVDRMIRLFLDNTPVRIRSARDGYDREDWTLLERSAHSMKSSAGNLGLTGLQSVAARVEEAAEARRHRDVRPLVEELEALYPPVRRRLEALLGAGDAGGTPPSESTNL